MGHHLASLDILSQWEFQDPKMEALYHIRPYLWGEPYLGSWMASDLKISSGGTIKHSVFFVEVLHGFL